MIDTVSWKQRWEREVTLRIAHEFGVQVSHFFFFFLSMSISRRQVSYSRQVLSLPSTHIHRQRTPFVCPFVCPVHCFWLYFFFPFLFLLLTHSLCVYVCLTHFSFFSSFLSYFSSFLFFFVEPSHKRQIQKNTLVHWVICGSGAFILPRKCRQSLFFFN